MKGYLKHILALFVIGLVVLLLGFYLDEDIRMGAGDGSYRVTAQAHGMDRWGYQIHFDSKLLIQQDYIPAVNGKQYFTCREDAEKAGQLVVDKIRLNERPSISIEELRVHGITFKK
ncbi:DUF4907 domain-containing protein [Flavobacteriaceae bacterium TP-CH-4]|uniref:DUF4907 domain-containing protein n=1 Tax=Pelagihabitans pacificus TaxID=2696054 RepID=A0A967E5M6_9FLAO|nr:DUF4907 domain-containing protein [Pelagihabitans pacificus]NHF59582.1 DUF4907 domain-containing protein [Pelagihabitans pacificus]